MPLDRATLRTPPQHGDVLIEPPVSRWEALLAENRARLAAADVCIGDHKLSLSRAEARTALVGRSELPLIVLGHQPEFFHPGVWAKHFLASQFARGVGGIALNLIVDSDVLKSALINVPHSAGGKWTTKSIRFASAATSTPFEFLPTLRPIDLHRLEDDFHAALGAAFESSALPLFFEGLRSRSSPRDWVEQAVAGRRAVDQAFGIELVEHRVSEISFTPLILETLREPRRFAGAYNDALRTYRQTNGIHNLQRPMPDLANNAERCELPWWAVRPHFPRQRLFIAEKSSRHTLLAEDHMMLELSASDLSSTASLTAALARQSTWAIRPRAITLTLWARLLLTDFFIHGIGGAKYDAVCDALIERYFHVLPPHFAAVSATLRWAPDAKRSTACADGDPRQVLRDARFNPQRHFPTTNAAAALFAERQAAIETTTKLARANPRNRAARRNAFQRIHAANDAILQNHVTLWRELESRCAETAQELRQVAIARGREYFFAAYPYAQLQNLATALSAVAKLAV